MLAAIGGHSMATATALPTPPVPGRFQARRAFRLLREVIRNPDDTDKVFEFFEAVGGDEGPRAFARLVARLRSVGAARGARPGRGQTGRRGRRARVVL
jgi:hypothetical protein